MINRITNKHIKIIGGVCAGIAYNLSMPVWLIRGLVAIITVLTGFVAIPIIYLFAWFLMQPLNVSEEEFNEETRPFVSKSSTENGKDENTKNDLEGKVDYNDLYSNVIKSEEKEKNS